MNSLRAVWRLARALVHALGGAATIMTRFPSCNAAQREAMVQAWALKLLALLGVQLELHGRPCATGPMLLVANHISWLDIVVMHAARYCRFVSKADVRRWPLIGILATGGGTIYIERNSRRDALRVVHRMAESLKRGEVVAVFPEGTTSDGVDLLPFHGNLIQAAVAANAPAQPVALGFIDTRTRALTLTPCYVGDDSFMLSMWRTLAGPPVTAVVRYGQPQLPLGRNRRVWAADLRLEVDQLRRAAYA
jgi:1-acyl-sn-glycerol-3-phosphate acyltransferase